ncbi:hypothetical protein [Urbifossiella limnaea]|uniref:Uncharacterized protein n=1 Tax=Urbifossiella limnaea TaxID=2528023 RepID=A0A517XWC3_9BACT|nr:hypothetical protein [Urbifossiella limnaea]QDU21811.1 hypothetical protein ETAA1_37840 [Urbifossiella limnaea]
MTAVVSARARRLSDALTDLKVKVRATLATELAGAVGIAVRDVLLVALVDRLSAPPRASTPAPLRGGWWGDGSDREPNPWDPAPAMWDDSGDDPSQVPAHYAGDERDAPGPAPVAPAAAVALGLSVGRWWLGRGGTGVAAVGFGVLATALGRAGGPGVRAALAVLAAATDVLTAEAALARHRPF